MNSMPPRIVRDSPHDTYFSALQSALQNAGIAWPTLVLDRDRMRRNASRLKALIAKKNRLRLVEKSLPVPSMLDELMHLTNTNAMMVFHEPQLRQSARWFADSDLLLGKPMPVQAVSRFYRDLGATTFDPSAQLQWLIDTPQRLQEYLQLAQGLGIRMRINFEIDVGLHRGGAGDPGMLHGMLKDLLAAPGHLEFSGLMGYDAHVGKLPALIERRSTSFTKSNRAYADFQDVVRHLVPDLSNTVCWNGAGSPTVALHHDGESPINDISAGSCLLKGTMFDLELLAEFEPAIFIASPILKAWDGTRLAGPTWLSKALFDGRASHARTYFTYGGDWRAEVVSPALIIPNKLFGVSYNQAMFSGPKRHALSVNDLLFLRPHQSEGILLQFGPIQVVDGGKVVDEWAPFTE